MTKTEKMILRFESKFTRADGCWIWRGTVNKQGYGRFSINRRALQAHRISYALSGKHLDNSLTLDHLCRNRACVNPAHLEPVTNRENILRGIGITAQNSKKTHCPKGHPYDEKNTYRYGNDRQCKICDRARPARRRAKVSQ